jgi:hypothetical protein
MLCWILMLTKNSEAHVDLQTPIPEWLQNWCFWLLDVWWMSILYIHAPNPFCFTYFSDKVSRFLPRLASSYAFLIVGMTGTMPWFFLTFCLCWTWTRILLISISWVGGITGETHSICSRNAKFLVEFKIWFALANPWVLNVQTYKREILSCECPSSCH